MADVWLIRTDRGLGFADDESKDWFYKKPIGKMIHVKAKVARDPIYHRKAMSLLRMAFQNIELPKGEYKGEPVEVSFEQFRHNMVVWAGYGKPTLNVKGEIRTDAQSLSYDECSQELIEKIYSDLLDLISAKFGQLAKTPEELDRLTEEWMRYT